MPDQQFIVAEVSKVWRGRRQGQWPTMQQSDLISGRFEHVINVNRDRGYWLHSFTLSQVITAADELTETIVAVFHKEPA